MADNDRYIIIKENESLKLIGGNSKTRAEYEDMIAESIYKKTVEENQTYTIMPSSERQKHFLKQVKKQCKIYAKAVVARLFGEGE